MVRLFWRGVKLELGRLRVLVLFHANKKGLTHNSGSGNEEEGNEFKEFKSICSGI